MRWLFFLAIFSCATAKPETPSLQPTTPATAIIPTTQPPTTNTTTQPTSSQPAAVLATPSTTKAPARCAKIEEVLDAEVFRGSPPKSQAQLNAEKSYTGKEYDRDDHFLKYVACEYKVGIKGNDYSYKDYISDITKIDEMKPSMCEAQRPEIESIIEKTTKKCTDLKGGEFYGYIFTPLK